ncbi:SGNH/GDSL hydrolase family protein [Paraburkholderia sp. BL10I2N1]|uniref:SGNH/GDSL hydrolase family protein n=1 Tax=Paraburkholderia sp. BL10I2N1 TaxID=1938796 RepID=UPI00105E0CF1|nr:SGNH/GDSL hydrolase family protein [Paraburkholderia sp. BL10I2N1]TDN70420.1 lysophospholipase L1-like esterase [Paraburkholderia sp. BL10I2N1]
MGYRANASAPVLTDSAGLAQFQSYAGSAPFGDSLLPSKAAALQRFYYQLGNAGSAACDLVFVGDSITTGFSLNIANRWQTLLRTLLRAKFQPAGVTGGRGYFSAMQAIGTPADYPVAATGTTLSNIDGMGAKAALLNGAGQKLVLTTGNVTAVDIFYYQNAVVGSWSYKLDGGGATTVTAGGATDAMHSVRISGLGGTAHTVEVDWVSGTGGNGAYIDGFMEYNGDEAAGLRFWDAGQSSVSAAALLTSAGFLSDFAKVQPSLVTVMLGVNDWGANNPSPQTAAQFKANLLTIISGIYTNTTTHPSIVLIPEWQVNPAGGVTPVDTWANFIAAMYSIARADPNVCIFDARSRINSGATSGAGGLLGDTTHPSPQGSVILANALFNFLTP